MGPLWTRFILYLYNMKETKRETVVVTEYTTDFGTVCPDEETCKEREEEEYKNVYDSLYKDASDKQKILLDEIMSELNNHLYSACCEQGISNRNLSELIYSIGKHRDRFY